MLGYGYSGFKVRTSRKLQLFEHCCAEHVFDGERNFLSFERGCLDIFVDLSIVAKELANGRRPAALEPLWRALSTTSSGLLRDELA